MKIFIDIDGFCSLANLSKESKSIAEGKSIIEDKLIEVAFEPQDIDCLVEQYYLGLRSAMFICEDTIKEESEAKEALNIWREASLKEAWAYVYSHITLGKVLSPDFMWDTKSVIIEELKDKYPEVVDIQLRFSMRPKLSAKVTGNNTIIFPALSRAILNHYNLLILNTISDITDEAGEVKNIEDEYLIDSDHVKRNNLRFMLPYLLFCHDNFTVGNLPIIGAYSEDIIIQVTRLTKLQLIFIFAHEYAHILLNHFENNELDLINKINIECDADNLALKVLFGFIEKDKSYSKSDVFIAIRWLFKYHLLEESVGILVKGEKIKFDESIFEERRSRLQLAIHNNYKSSCLSMLETMGFYMLVNIQNILYNLEPEYVNYIIYELKEAKKTGVVESWWENISMK